MSKKRSSLPLIGFFQALGLALYCGLVGMFFWKAGQWFTKSTPVVLQTMIMLVLFVASALISALIMLCYPFILFWEKKDTKRALVLIGYSTGWLVLFLVLALSLLFLI